MLTRKDLELIGVVMTDEQWKEFCKLNSELEEKEWNDSHPLDN